MDLITAYLPQVISTVLLVVLALTIVTNIIVQVLKGVTYGKIPTNLMAVAVAIIVTLVAFFAAAATLDIAVTWYTVAGSIGLGFFVAYASMFGFDKLKEALEQITKVDQKNT